MSTVPDVQFPTADQLTGAKVSSKLGNSHLASSELANVHAGNDERARSASRST